MMVPEVNECGFVDVEHNVYIQYANVFVSVLATGRGDQPAEPAGGEVEAADAGPG